MTRLAGLAAALACAVLSLTAAAQTTAPAPRVVLERDVDAAAYPRLTLQLGVVNELGRPVPALGPGDVIASDESGQLTVEAVEAIAAPDAPVAWLLLVDVSGSMAESRPDGTPYLDAAKTVARDFVAAASANDIIRLVTFAERTTSVTNWLAPGDPVLLAAIDGLAAPPGVTSLSRGLTEASVMAGSPPPPVQRRAIVLVTDMDSRDRDPSLTLDAIRGQLQAPLHTFSLRQPVDADAEMTLFLSDLTAYTGGSYGLATGSEDLPTRYASIVDDLHRSWSLTLDAPGLPDGAEHALDLIVSAAGVEAGRIATLYRSGSLFEVSPLEVSGLASGDEVSGDVDIRVGFDSAGWSAVRLDLFKDCEPGSCEPVHATDTGVLEYRLLAGALGQGDHTITVRATVRDDSGREFTDSCAVPFTRAGTTLNYGAMVLIGGIALAGVAGTALAVRRRKPPGSPP